MSLDKFSIYSLVCFIFYSSLFLPYSNVHESTWAFRNTSTHKSWLNTASFFVWCPLYNFILVFLHYSKQPYLSVLTTLYSLFVPLSSYTNSNSSFLINLSCLVSTRGNLHFFLFYSSLLWSILIVITTLLPILSPSPLV